MDDFLKELAELMDKHGAVLEVNDEGIKHHSDYQLSACVNGKGQLLGRYVWSIDIKKILGER